MEDRIENLFTNRGLRKFTRIYMIEMRLTSLSQDSIALEEFKLALEEDFRWKRGLTDRWGIRFHYFWARTKPVNYFGVYQIRYIIFSNKEWIEPKGVVTWRDFAKGSYNEELIKSFKDFLSSDQIDKKIWGENSKFIKW